MSQRPTARQTLPEAPRQGALAPLMIPLQSSLACLAVCRVPKAEACAPRGVLTLIMLSGAWLVVNLSVGFLLREMNQQMSKFLNFSNFVGNKIRHVSCRAFPVWT